MLLFKSLLFLLLICSQAALAVTYNSVDDLKGTMNFLDNEYEQTTSEQASKEAECLDREEEISHWRFNGLKYASVAEYANDYIGIAASYIDNDCNLAGIRIFIKANINALSEGQTFDFENPKEVGTPLESSFGEDYNDAFDTNEVGIGLFQVSPYSEQQKPVSQISRNGLRVAETTNIWPKKFLRKMVDDDYKTTRTGSVTINNLSVDSLDISFTIDAHDLRLVDSVVVKNRNRSRGRSKSAGFVDGLISGTVHINLTDSKQVTY